MITIKDDDEDQQEVSMAMLLHDDDDGETKKLDKRRVGRTAFIDLSREEEMNDNDFKQHRTIDTPDEREQAMMKLLKEVEQLRSDVAHLTTLVKSMHIKEEQTTSCGMKSICVSGQFCVEHRILAEMIRAKGFRYSETLTLECDYLIVPTLDHKSQKTERAVLYGVSIRDYTFFSDSETQ